MCVWLARNGVLGRYEGRLWKDARLREIVFGRRDGTQR